MKIKIILGTLTLFLSLPFLEAQDKAENISNEINKEDNPICRFCKPGVRNKSRTKGMSISYRTCGEGIFNERGTSFSEPKSSFEKIQKFEANIKFPIINKESFKFILGYQFHLEQYDFENVGVDYTDSFHALDNTHLKRNAFSMIAIKPLTKDAYFVFSISSFFVGNYSGWLNFEKDKMLFDGVAAYIKKPSEDLEWGFALNVSKNFKRILPIPVFIYNKNFNNKWGIESALPSFVYGRYNISGKQILIFGTKFQSDSYFINTIDSFDDELSFAFRHAEVVTSVQLQQQFSNWVWANIELGYQANLNTKFRYKSESYTDFKTHPNNTLYFKLGLFLSPPDKLMKKH